MSETRFRSPYAISSNCPVCGDEEHERVKPATAVAFAADRVCRRCGTRYTPPTPAWARLVFTVLGIGLPSVCVWGMTRDLVKVEHGLTGIIAGVLCLFAGFAIK